MKRIGALRLVAVLWLFLIASGPSSAVRLKAVHSVKRVVHAPVLKQRKFRLVEKSCESGCDETYESADGQQLSFVFACFSATPADARRDMQSLAAEGRVVNKRSWLNRRGRRVERVVAFYPADETHQRPVKILWYRQGDACFSYIDAGSLKLAREFERSSFGAKSLSQYSR